MKTSSKIVIVRTALVFSLILAAAAVTLAVGADEDQGSLLDDQGIIDRELIETTESS